MDEDIKKCKDKIQEKNKELEGIQKSKPESLWIDDLNNFLSEYKKMMKK